jgi:hypothetical protein
MFGAQCKHICIQTHKTIFVFNAHHVDLPENCTGKLALEILQQTGN